MANIDILTLYEGTADPLNVTSLSSMLYTSGQATMNESTSASNGLKLKLPLTPSLRITSVQFKSPFSWLTRA